MQQFAFCTRSAVCIFYWPDRNLSSRNSFNISSGMSKRGLPGVSFSSFPGAKQFLAAVSRLIRLIAIWWNDDNSSAKAAARQVNSVPHLTCSNISTISYRPIKHPDLTLTLLTLLTSPQWNNTVTGDETGFASQLISTPILPTRPTKGWPQHRELRALLFSINVWVL